MDTSDPRLVEVTRRTIHQGRKFSFEQVTLRTPGGNEITRECVRHPGAVVILPILEGAGGEPQVLFVRNERFSIGKGILELPAGTREPGEEPGTTAARELEEETGYQAATVRELTRFYTTPGMTDELMWGYVARRLTRVGQRLEEDEALTVVPVGASRAIEMATRGELEDGKSILTLLLARALGIL
jgi:ADP-ribose pyrophosphatase